MALPNKDRGHGLPIAGDVGSSDADDVPGVPGFRTWKGVYLFVFGFFVAMVIALTIFARFYA
jgi:hypothetical protein